MVALAKEQKTSQWDYVSACIDNMYIDQDARGPVAWVPSQSGSFKHQVRFVEPRGEVPHAVSCTCQSYHYRKACLHCDIVNLYYEMIYDHTPAIYDESASASVVIGNAEMDALVAQLEKEFGLVEEIAPVVTKSKKVRRSAKNEALIAELGAKVTKKVGIAQVRRALKKPTNSPEMSSVCPTNAPQCPQNAPSVPQVTIEPCKAIGAKFEVVGPVLKSA